MLQKLIKYLTKVMVMGIETDLHMHSIYSDGTYTPQEILDIASRKGLKLISITDHNCVSPVAGHPNILQGIEISAEQIIDSVHVKGLEILGYGFNAAKMKKKIEQIRKSKIDALIQGIANFNKLDFESNLFRLKDNVGRISVKNFFEFKWGRSLTEEELNNLMQSSTPSKLELAEFLCDTFFEFNPAIQQAYGEIHPLFKKEFSDTIFKIIQDDKITLFEAIHMVKECGGVAILAHPALCGVLAKKWFNETVNGMDPVKLLLLLKDQGLDGVELYNYHGVVKYTFEASTSINKYFKDLSKKLGLVNSWGSDCHGEQWWGMQIGTFGATIEEIRPLLHLMQISL
jgi:hypothetical protein